MELLAEELDEQMEMIESFMKRSHHLDREEMAQLLSEVEQRKSREDDQCLVWISFDEG
jgi:hypothetical protein